MSRIALSTKLTCLSINTLIKKQLRILLVETADTYRKYSSPLRCNSGKKTPEDLSVTAQAKGR
jgi:hypothetical protein